MAERLAVFRDRYDTFRSAVVNEPRGSDVMVGRPVCEPVDPACAAGVIFFNNVGYLGMCGHGTIGVAVALAHLGRIGPGTHRLETPVGVVDGHARRPQHASRSTTSPSYRLAKDVQVDVPGLGDLRRRRRLGRQLVLPRRTITARRSSLANVERLTDVTWRIRQALDRAGHHRGRRRRDRPHRAVRPADARRTPTARTSSSAPARPTTARRAAPAPAPSSPAWSPTASSREGEVWRQESIIGSVFEGSVRIVERPDPAAHPRHGLRQCRGDPDPRPADPFAMGIRP